MPAPPPIVDGPDAAVLQGRKAGNGAPPAPAEVPVEELTTCPVADMQVLEPYRNPAIPLPTDIFGRRANSAGIDLSDPLVREPLMERLEALEAKQWVAEPTFM